MFAYVYKILMEPIVNMIIDLVNQILVGTMVNAFKHPIKHLLANVFSVGKEFVVRQRLIIVAMSHVSIKVSVSHYFSTIVVFVSALVIQDDIVRLHRDE